MSIIFGSALSIVSTLLVEYFKNKWQQEQLDAEFKKREDAFKAQLQAVTQAAIDRMAHDSAGAGHAWDQADQNKGLIYD